MDKKNKNTYIGLGIIAVGLAAGIGAYLLAKGEEDPLVDPPAQKFPCPYCSAVFNSEEDLWWHIQTVHPEKTVEWQYEAAIAAALAIEALNKAQKLESQISADLDNGTTALIDAIGAYDTAFARYNQYPTEEALDNLTAALSLIESAGAMVRSQWNTILDGYKNAAEIATNQAEIAYAAYLEIKGFIVSIYESTDGHVRVWEKRDFRDGHSSRFPIGRFGSFNYSSFDQYAVPGSDPIRNGEISSLSVDKYYKATFYTEIKYQGTPVTYTGAVAITSLAASGYEDKFDSLEVMPNTDKLEDDQDSAKSDAQDAKLAAMNAITNVNSVTGDIRLFDIMLKSITSARDLVSTLQLRLDALIDLE